MFSIGPSAFYQDVTLGSITIGNGLTNIEDGTFASCSDLTNVVLTSSVERIGDGAFGGCTALGSIKIPDGVASIGDGAFSDCHLTNVSLGGHLSDIGRFAFDRCSLTSLSVPDSVTNIGDYAFRECPVANLKLGNSLTTIGVYAFAGCANLTSVTIPNNVASIGPNAFGFCTSLKEITVNQINSVYSSLDGVLLNKSQTDLVQCPAGKRGNFLIPITVTNLENFEFAWCTNLTNLYLQGNPPSIGSDTFDGDINATVYYLTGTTGWDSTFGGIPSVLWNPQAQTGDASFGVVSNQFGFNITGTANIPVVVEASTNLAGPGWSPLQTMTLTNGLVYFSDPQWTNYPSRFYRIRSQ